MERIVYVILFIAWVASTLWHFTYLLQFFQLYEYHNLRFMQWSLKNWRRVLRPLEWIIYPFLVAGLLVRTGSPIWTALPVVWISCMLGTVLITRERQKHAIKPLVYTARVKRLIGAGLFLLLLEGIFFFWFGFSVLRTESFYLFWAQISPLFQKSGFLEMGFARGGIIFLLGLWTLGQLNFINLVLANGILYPVEALLRQYYVYSAAKILREMHPIVIGITGSYGKTSTKEALAHLLSHKFTVLKTPHSYNTLMGICKVIREELKPEHRYFVVEMGAYIPGEIKRICQLVHPQMGILTAIGPQHLERFKTLENVARAKYELIAALPPDGVAVLNGDDPRLNELARQIKVKTLLYGVDSDDTNVDLRAENLKPDQAGTAFEVVQKGRSPEKARIKLLGRHNVSNVLGAMLTALECGLTLKETIYSAALLPTFEHRLQLVKSPQGITYIDDAYNSNPAGAKMALEVLAAFKEGRKILVTPGYVELGSLEVQEHTILGMEAAAVCDYIFLIGSQIRVEPILTGAVQAGFDRERIFCFPTLNEARVKLTELVKPGDVVLFENDLPDIY